MKASKAFQKLWQEIENPHSASPDISIGRVLDYMTQIFTEDQESFTDIGDPVERWVLCTLSILNIPQTLVSLQFRFNDLFYYADSNSDWEAQDKAMTLREENVAKALESLLKNELIVESKDKHGKVLFSLR